MVKFDGTLAGVEGSAGSWMFEGVEYNTPAGADDLAACAEEAMALVDKPVLDLAHKLVFGPGTQYTSQALLAIVEAYEREVGETSPNEPGPFQVVTILREAARRIACIEALTI